MEYRLQLFSQDELLYSAEDTTNALELSPGWLRTMQEKYPDDVFTKWTVSVRLRNISAFQEVVTVYLY
jgi:hypothetical protein